MKIKIFTFFLSLSLFTIIGNTLTAQVFSPVANGVNNDVFALKVFNNNLYLGGIFTECYGNDTIVSPMLAKYNGSSFDSSGIDGWSGGGVTNFYVNNTDLFVAGDFSLPFDSIRGINNIAKFNGTWGDTTYSLNNTVNCMINYHGNLYAGGTFHAADSGAVNYIAKWDTASHHWKNVSIGTTNGEVKAFEIFNDRLYAAGNFTLIDGVAANYISRWNDTVWQPIGLGVIGSVSALKTYDTMLYAGGDFVLQGVDTVNHIVALDAHDVWHKLGNGMGADPTATVTCFEVHNFLLYIGGNFNETSAAPGNAIVSWNGTAFTRLNNGINASNGVVYALQSWNNSLYIGGSFVVADSIAVNNICKYDAPAGISETKSNVFVQTFPNPASKNINFNIHFNDHAALNGCMIINDIVGRQVMTAAIHQGLNTIDIKTLSKGIYIYTINNNINSCQGKFIVE
ncbi:MAG: T9SS type A sorting domain-containing protein [Bacteroidota bacterium]